MKSNKSGASTSHDQKTQDKCIAVGCNNFAVSHSEWDNEYCSVICCYNHCKATFRAWLASNKKTKRKQSAGSSSQGDVSDKCDEPDS